MKNLPYGLAAAVLIAAFSLFHHAFADSDYMPQGVSANLSRPCSLEGISSQAVAVTGTSAATSSYLGIGTVRIVCTQDAHMKVGALGVTGVTAGTGDLLLTGYGPEYFYTRGSQFAFVRDVTSGTCFVTECK